MSVPVVKVGDSSSHGGVIQAGSPSTLVDGLPVARLGDLHSCPLFYPHGVPHGVTPILTASQVTLADGIPVARNGDVVGCGASLIGVSPTLSD